jgi:hypothetical protein
MTTLLGLRTLALTFVAPAAALLPTLLPPTAEGLSSLDAIALHARYDPELGSLRAGSVDAPAPFGALERSELATAQQESSSLDALRAGSAPSDHEWKWLAVGAAIVLLIVLL